MSSCLSEAPTVAILRLRLHTTAQGTNARSVAPEPRSTAQKRNECHCPTPQDSWSHHPDNGIVRELWHLVPTGSANPVVRETPDLFCSQPRRRTLLEMPAGSIADKRVRVLLSEPLPISLPNGFGRPQRLAGLAALQNSTFRQNPRKDLSVQNSDIRPSLST